MNTDIFYMCILIVTVVFSLVSVLLTLEYIKKNRYFRYKQEKDTLLDEERRYYEEQLYKLQNELMENERRWKDANHLIINGQSETKIDLNEKNVFSKTFFENLGINLDTIEIERKSVFVLTPFIDEESKTFNQIKEVCGEVDLKCSRGDEVYRNNDILSHIISSILKSNIVIANINGRNPNVFYELGICHAIGKPVILISKTKNDLPFDIKSKNIIFYKDFSELQMELKSELLKIFING